MAAADMSPHAILLAVAAFAVLVAGVQLARLRGANARLQEQNNEARRRIAELNEAMADREARSERGRRNSIQLSENQIEAVNDGSVSFRPKPVMNRGEVEVFYAARRALDRRGLRNWHVFPQVSLGEVIGTDSDWEFRAKRAHQSINSKRCDVLIADAKGLPVAFVEHQGSGHYQGDAEQRDAVKRIAARRAGIGFVEVPDGLSRDQIVELLSKAI